MSQIVIVGHFELHPDDASAAAELMQVMMNETVKEVGCHHYAFARDLSSRHLFQLSELWEDLTALDAHFRTEHMATFRAGIGKLRVQRRAVRRYDAANPVDL